MFLYLCEYRLEPLVFKYILPNFIGSSNSGFIVRYKLIKFENKREEMQIFRNQIRSLIRIRIRM